MSSSPLLLSIALVPGCGSRTETDEARPGNAEVDGGKQGGDQDEGEGDDALTAASAELGTIANPCSDEAPEGGAEGEAPGVSADTIRIGVISDKENPAVPLPTVGAEESVEAFVAFCNDAGGIDGRQLELVTYDSQIAKTEEATTSAGVHRVGLASSARCRTETLGATLRRCQQREPVTRSPRPMRWPGRCAEPSAAGRRPLAARPVSSSSWCAPVTGPSRPKTAPSPTDGVTRSGERGES